MAKKIVASVTLHVKDEKKSVEFKYDNNGILLAGKTVVIEAAPGTPVEIDDAEADALIERQVARLYEEPKTVAKAEKA